MCKQFYLPVIAFSFLACAFVATAQQKVAYVDIATVMQRLPEAQDAQRQLDNQVDSWQKELDNLEKEWQEKYSDYDKRKLILTEQGRANAERELQALDAQIMEFRDKKFGQNGELFKKEEELMRPIQNMIFEQVKLLAKDKGFDYIIDKSSGATIIYANEKYDLTEDLIKRIESTLPARQTSATQEFETGKQNTTGNQGVQEPGKVSPPPSQDRPGGK